MNSVKIFLFLLVTILFVASCRSTNLRIYYNKKETISLIKNTIGYSISAELAYYKKLEIETGDTNYIKYPFDKPINVRIANFDPRDRLFYCLIEYPEDVSIEKRTAYTIANDFGVINAKTLTQFQRLDKTVQNALEHNYIREKIAVTKDKAWKIPPPTKEVLRANKVWLKRVFNAIEKYFSAHKELIDKYGDNLKIKISGYEEFGEDYSNVIVGNDCVNVFITSEKDDAELKLWVHTVCLEDEHKLSDEFVVEKSGWNRSIDDKDKLKIYTLQLSKKVAH